ncbi:F-box domain protein [Ophiocordyceps camponoti-floridani]|uniref:F-box domain protein n=1 Tax=Ophiocordyceps camponoti-floridani TaxID=2030778 RepID=A0A8H4QCG7_9HYPO|nr:F-box domain protein [Ophiocordyceps camponoti-floridani]
MRLPFSRKKEKKKSDASSPYPDDLRPWGAVEPLRFPPTRASAQLLAQLPRSVLQRIFVFVCPHSRDDSYDTCEESASDTGCMLCDLRDLSHCAQVGRAWRASAITVMYHSVRIDPVHYCKLEAFLAEKRKKTSRFDRNGIPEDPALARLRLFRRTVRDDPTRIGKLVQFLKTPYMIRESCHVELAQTIAVLPNLQYVDLPEGMFADEPNYATLRLEVQARCPDLRKMTYVRGSEPSFASLATGRVWPRLEVLELDRVDVDPLVLRTALASLTRLRALKVSETPSFSDEVMAADDGLPPLPALEELIVKDAPRMTTAGLVEYLSWYETQKALKVLTIKDTGVQPSRLQDVLGMAPALRTLAFQTKVKEPMQNAEAAPLLASMRLKTLRFEISAKPEAGPYATPGYYSHLAASVLAGSLPRLRRLYVLDDSFPDKLSGLPPPLPPPAAVGAGNRARPGSSSSNTGSAPALRVLPGGPMSPGMPPPRRRVPSMGGGVGMGGHYHHKRFSSNNPFAQRASGPPPTQTLEVFTKSDEFGKWNFARVDSFTGGGGGAVGGGVPVPGLRQRPVSSYGLAADVAGQGWDRSEARRSVLIGDGIGGFLAVPGGAEGAGLSPPRGFSDAHRPRSSGEESTKSRRAFR